MNEKLNGLLRRILPALLLALVLTITPRAGQTQGWWKNNMEVVGSYNIPGYTTDVQICGTRAYLLTDAYSPGSTTMHLDYITILNIADPAKPQLLATYYADFDITSMAVVGTKIYLLGYELRQGVSPYTIYVLETSNPKVIPTPERIQLPPMTTVGYRQKKIKIYQSAAYLYGVNSNWTIVNLANPNEIKEIEGTSYVFGLTIAGSKAFLLTGHTLSIYDVTNPLSPVKLLQQNVEYSGGEQTVVGSKVYTLSYNSDGPSVLHITQAYTPTSPYLLGEYNTPGQGNDIAVYGTLAYIADGNQGVHVYDVSQPLALDFVRASYYTPGNAMRVKMVGSLAYVATYGSGLLILKYTGNDAPITLTQPAANTTWKIGSTAAVNWSVNTKVAGTAVRFELWSAGAKVADLGNGYTNTTSVNSTTVKVPATLAPGNDYAVRAVSYWDPTFWDESSRITLVK